MAKESLINNKHEAFESLFMSLAEGLKLPLQQIARRAELGLMIENSNDSLSAIHTNADTTLQLLDGYLLSLRLSQQPEERFQVEPVCMSAVLHDACLQLSKVADQYGVLLELDISGKYSPVMAHRHALKAALVSIGYSLIEAIPAMGIQQQRLQLVTHRTSHGVVAGMYFDTDTLTPLAFRKAQKLKGNTRQPLVGVSPNSGAGIFVADAILQAMSSRLKVGRYKKASGFTFMLPPSKQLQLV